MLGRDAWAMEASGRMDASVPRALPPGNSSLHATWLLPSVGGGWRAARMWFAEPPIDVSGSRGGGQSSQDLAALGRVH